MRKTMTNITINNKKHTIELTKKDYNKASKFGTPEYNDLQEARKAYPGYKVIIAVRKTTSSSYKGLTYEYMKAYIEKHDDDKKSRMADFLMFRAKDEASVSANAVSAHYQEIKAWFLETYPEIEKFHNDRIEKLAEVQAKREAKNTAKRIEMAKAIA